MSYSSSIDYYTRSIYLDVINGETIKTCQSLGFDYFDSTSHDCQTCYGDGITVDKTNLNILGDSTQCTCKSGFYQSYKDCSNVCAFKRSLSLCLTIFEQDQSGNCISFSCTSCQSSSSLNSTSYSDRSGCVVCGNSTLGVSPITLDCQCPDDQVLVESDNVGNKLSEKQCLVCPAQKAVIKFDTTVAGVYYSADLYSCRACPDPLMTMTLSLSSSSYVCSCPSSYILTGVAAIEPQSCTETSLARDYQALALQSAPLVTYYSYKSTVVLSQTILHYFTRAASYCAYYGGAQDNRYCQTLANLCVLQLYDDSTIVCQTFQSILSARGSQSHVNDILSWGLHLPWLSYQSASGQPPVSLICLNKGYSTSVNLNSQLLKYVLAETSLNGTFLGYRNLDSLFSYCSRASPDSEDGGGTSTRTDWQVFANTVNQISLTCDLSRLISQPQSFYELFLTDSDDSPVSYYPIPVRIRNLRVGGRSVNSVVSVVPILCEETDVLVRRFVLFDRVSGISAASSISSPLNANNPTATYVPDILRYATTISLQVALTSDTSGHIYSPVLTIEYKEVPSGSWASDLSTSNTLGAAFTAGESTGAYTISTAYVVDLTNFYYYVLGFYITGIVLFAVLVLLRYYTWAKRNARLVTDAHFSTDFGGLNLRVIFELCLIGIHTYVIVFFPFTLLICWYCFVTLKLQKAPSFLLPPIGPTPTEFYNNYYLFIINLYLMVFFQIVYVCITILYRHSNAEIFFIDWESSREGSNQTAGFTNPFDKKGRSSRPIVSIWRTMFIANEYCQLSIKRRTNVTLTLFFLGLILIGSNYQYDATQQPALMNKNPEEKVNPVLRFATTMWWWLLLSGGQYLFKFLIYERFLAELPEQVFIDLCTLAKVSVLILDEQYHGYYLHCRSPHPYADGTMQDLIDMLSREEAGLTVDRALEGGGPPDVQSFQLFLSYEWRQTFDKIYTSLVTRQGTETTASRRAAASSTGATASSSSTPFKTLFTHVICLLLI